jgi:hypothetical protein
VRPCRSPPFSIRLIPAQVGAGTIQILVETIPENSARWIYLEFEHSLPKMGFDERFEDWGAQIIGLVFSFALPNVPALPCWQLLGVVRA